MAQKKAYSRYFIILQQDESGYSLSSDKIPSGYTKLETKNDKCKISYYVQNLKKEEEPYYMLLICSKKDVKKLIKLGIMNIDDHGRAEVTYEYSTGNISESGISIDMVTGAAVVKLEESNMVSVMSGFASSDVPGDWRTYDIYDNRRGEEQEEKTEDVKEAALPIEVENEIVEEKPVENNIFEEYEARIEKVKEPEDSAQVEEKEPVLQEKLDASQDNSEEKAEASYNNAEEIQSVSSPSIEYDESELRKEEQLSDNEKKAAIESENKVEQDDEYPIGTVGDFFRIVAEGFEEVKDACKEIKRCRWYKVNVNALEDMCNASNYNRYTLVYYPMMSYYPYIRKHGHYLMGYKYDASGKMKYIVYGIPGSKNVADQPYAGRSGFVTWVSLKEGEERDNDYGYWLMFYDFRTSTIVIPVK